MSSPNKLTISRWHLDCITQQGDFFLGETISVRSGSVQINLLSGISGLKQTVDRKLTVAFKEVLPIVTGPEINWICPPLQLSGQWDTIVPRFERTLFADESQIIDWHCAGPKTKVRLQIGSDKSLAGIGYVDHVRIAAENWSAPISEIRFGRFLTEQESWIWINLDGVFSRPWVWRNGVEQPLAAVSDDLITLGDGHTLGLVHKHPIREGQFGDTVVQSLPALRPLVPQGMARIFESTWMSKGTLLKSTEKIDSGWALHQRIRFPG